MKKFIPLSAAIALTFGVAQAVYADTSIDASQMHPMAGEEPTFGQVDANGDGAVSREEAAASGLNITWSKADKDGNGSLSEAEYKAAVSGSAGMSAPK